MENTKITYACEECGKAFTTKRNLKRHISMIHSSQQKYICYHCSKDYSTKYNLIRHISQCTNTKPNGSKEPCDKDVKCVLCNNYKGLKSNLLQHYEVEHDIHVITEDFCLPSLLEFENWKDDVEKNTISKYVKRDLKKSNSKTIYYYQCNRNGFYKSEGKKKRHLKLKGSNKINGYCPSKIDVAMNKTTGEVNIHFVKTHVGHTMDLGKIPLKKADRDLLASKISQKIPFDELINELRDGFDKSNFSRIHLLTRKDLFNIEQLYNLNKDSVCHANDVKLCCPETSRTSDVFWYKEKLSHMFQGILDNANTIEQCKVINKALVPLQPTLDVLKVLHNNIEHTYVADASTSSNKNLTGRKVKPQKRFIPTKNKRTNRAANSNKWNLPTNEEKNKLAVQFLH